MKKLALGILFCVLSTFSFAENQKTVSIEKDSIYFTDTSYSKLKKGVKKKDLKKIQNENLRDMAYKLYHNTYDAEYRVASYKATPSSQALAKELKIGYGYSQYENITGVFLEAGEAVVLISNLQDKEVQLFIPYWMRKPDVGIEPTKDPNGWGLHKQVIPLKEGVNVINVERSGNCYIHYFDDEPETAPIIKAHFLTGKVNGYFDASIHDNSDWNRLIDRAVSPILDAKGKYIQVAYPVEWFKEYTYNQGVELIANYDKIIFSEYALMGLDKYNKIPTNHILARVNFNYYMFRDGDGVAYLGDARTMKMVATPSIVIMGDPCWGFSHEVGHVLQMEQLTWGGMTEVSNNIYSMYTAEVFGNGSRLLAQDNYSRARKSIIESEPKISYLQDPDVFNRLVPFWQLYLYFKEQGYEDFYPDLMEELRNRPNAGSGNESINNMFEFIKIACYIGNTDLTDFFDQWGFFYVGTIKVQDYANYEFYITESDVSKVKQYIANKKYPKPAYDITTITD